MSMPRAASSQPTPSLGVVEGSRPGLVRGLSLLDSVLLLCGGIIGSGIFLTAGQIAEQVRTPGLFLLVWVAGGMISLLACFAFAELGSMFPSAGGQYVYLREAYGEFWAFLYGWMNFAVSGAGTIAALAVGFAEYFGVLIPVFSARIPVAHIGGWAFTRGHAVAIASIVVLTAINVLGLRRAALFQNVATFLKFAAIAIFVALGFLIGKGSWSNFTAPAEPNVGVSPFAAFGVALIAVFWAYDGWVYITWVAGEVKDPRRNVPRALVIGVIVVGVLYIALNAVYLYALPVARIAGETTIAQTAAVSLFSPDAAGWLAAMIAVSCFGAMSSGILCYARVYYAMAMDGTFFRSMAYVHPRYRTPSFSLVVQGIWTVVLALSGTYEQLFTYTMFMMVLSYVATVAGLFVLRYKRPDAPRPYRCSGYPWVPALYILIGGAWALNAAVERPTEAVAGIAICLIGVPGYLYWRRRSQARPVALPESTQP
ncbi:MAG TPA: amino acid permease [Terriglobales bacterium]|nr:amino acid permease [Terriglobales bacterium]